MKLKKVFKRLQLHPLTMVLGFNTFFSRPMRLWTPGPTDPNLKIKPPWWVKTVVDRIPFWLGLVNSPPILGFLL